MSYEPAAVVLFAYRRVGHVRRVIESLLCNAEALATPLVIYSDGPRDRTDQAAVADVRRYIAGVRGFRDIRVVAREENFGLARSTIDGLTEVSREYGVFIMLEDDTVVSPCFLAFMNSALHLYETDERVVSVSAYNFPSSRALPETFFLREANCWGWGTWARGWALMETDGCVLIDRLTRAGCVEAFNMNGTCDYFRMLNDQVRGKNDSWSVRWRASAFLSGKLTLHPGRSLVRNIGNDGTGTHSRWVETDVYDAGLADRPIVVEQIPVEECEVARLEHERFARWFAVRKAVSVIRLWLRKLCGRKYAGRHEPG